MIELTKGNEKDLEGKVIVYAKLKTKDGNDLRVLQKEGDNEYPVIIEDGHIFALYLATNPTDFKERTGASTTFFEEMSKKIEAMKEIAKNIGKEPKITPVYAAPIPIASEVDLKLGSEDVLFVGEYSNPERCMQAVNKGSDIYLIKFNDQLERKHELNGFQKEVEQEPSKPTYKDEEFKGTALRDYILPTFIAPMVTAQMRGDHKEFIKVKKEFIMFSAKAPFFTDVLDLCHAISESKKTINTEVTDTYLAKIIALHTEDYGAAAKIRDKIKGFSK